MAPHGLVCQAPPAPRMGSAILLPQVQAPFDSLGIHASAEDFGCGTCSVGSRAASLAAGILYRRIGWLSDRINWHDGPKTGPTRVIELKVTRSKRLWQLSMYGWERHYSLTQNGHWGLGGMGYLRYLPLLTTNPTCVCFPNEEDRYGVSIPSGLGFEKGQGIQPAKRWG
jgi:hypothetical protein